MDLIPARWRPLVLISLAVGIAILAAGYIPSDPGEDDGGALGWVIVSLITIAVTFALWKFVVGPRMTSVATGGTTALVLGILTVVGVLFYWTGLPYALGPAAIALGKETDTDSKGKAGMVLGALGLAVAVIGGFIDSVL